MKKLIHPVGGAIALLTIVTFWLSTVLSELSGSTAAIIAVKSAIPWGFLLLIPALAATGGSGITLANGVRIGTIGTKLKRTIVAGATGLLVLVPAALYLAAKASAGEFDTAFYTVQTVELLAGALNLSLLGLNMRDGFRLTGRMTRSAQPAVEVALLSSSTVAEGTMAFRFAKPAGFVHVAGQSAVFTLIDPSETDAEGSSRTFTIASAPHEPELMVVTRMRDTAFKRVLKTLPRNGLVRISAVGGAMILHEDATRPAVFLAGGIGITPFRAMASEATNARLPHRITLFYSNGRPDLAPFLEELRGLESINPNFQLVATTTEQGPNESWLGETGFIDEAMLRRHVPDLLAPVYYLAGPPAMVGAMQEMLRTVGVAGGDIRFEAFLGY